MWRMRRISQFHLAFLGKKIPLEVQTSPDIASTALDQNESVLVDSEGVGEGRYYEIGHNRAKQAKPLLAVCIQMLLTLQRTEGLRVFRWWFGVGLSQTIS